MTETQPLDASVFKAGLEQEWRDAAPGWRRWHDTMETDEGSLRLSRLLVELARLDPGDEVLDVGAGYGEPGLTAARAVDPGGRVLLQDLSGDMLAFAEERLGQAGLDDVTVQFVERDAEMLEVPAAGFDAVVSRAAIMYLVDVVGTLARFLQDVAPPVTALVADRPAEVQRQVWQRVTEQAWEPFVEHDGRVRLPNEAYWVAAVNPS